MFVAVRLKGDVGVSKKTKDTLKILNLNKKFSCIVVPETDSYKGMLKKVKNMVTWGEINENILLKLIKKRGKNIEKKLEKMGYKDLDELVNTKNFNIKTTFNLSPPSRGFKKNLKEIYPKGALGYRGEKINQLLKKMI